MRSSRDLAVLSGLFLFAAACGSSSPSSSGSNDGSAESGAEAASDAAGGGGDAPAADDASDASVALDAPGTDASVDAAPDRALDAPSGSDAAIEASVDAPADAPADSPPDASCPGANLQTDSHNCGACGVTCSTSGACSVGHCTDVLVASSSVNSISGYAKGIRVDGSGVYVTSANSACVFSIPLGGGTPNPIISPALTGVTGSYHLVIVGASVYWTTGGGHSVYSVATAGGAATPVTTGENDPEAIVTDGTNVYWTDGSRIRYTPAGSVSPATLAITADGGNPVQSPTALAVDGTYVYWSNAGAIWRASKTTGGAATPLLQSSAYNIQGITVDASAVYFTSNYGILGVYAVPIGGGSVTTLTAGATSPTAIASDATSVYWLDQYVVRKIAKTGDVATLETLASYSGALATALPNGGTFNDLTLDGTYVYFTQSANGAVFAVYRSPKG